MNLEERQFKLKNFIANKIILNNKGSRNTFSSIKKLKKI